MTKKALMLVAGSVMALSAPVALASDVASNEILADAAARSSYAAGYDGGFMISDDSRSNVLKIGGYSKFRYQMNFRDIPAGSTEEDFTHGFYNRNTRIQLSGNVWDPNFGFVVQGDFDADGAFSMRDAYASYKFDNGWSVKWGQFKLPYLAEELMSDTMILTAERSAANATFTGGRSQGVAFGFKQDKWRLWGAFSDGAQADNTQFDSASESDWAFTARGEFLFSGDNWDRFNDATSWRGEGNYAGKLGAAIHFQDGGSTGATGGATDEIQIFGVTVDAQVEGDGWNAFGAFILQSTDDATLADSVTDFGFVLQAGYFVTDSTEIFGRWDGVFGDQRGAFDPDPYNALTFGANHYLSPKSHAVKFTGNFVYFLEAEANTIVSADNNLNFLPTTEDGQFGVTFQAQFVY